MVVSAPIENNKQPSKLRWGDEEDGEDLEFLLPEPVVRGPDHNGLKKLVEYKMNEDGAMVKITTTTRVRKLADARVSKRAVERRSWAKFGDAVKGDDGERRTVVSTEEIRLERPRAPGTKAEEAKTDVDAGAVLKLCRSCGKKGDHWTAQCPYKGLASPSETFTEQPPTSGSAPKGTYVPPSMREGALRSSGTDMRRRNDENSVRVSNLSEDTREADLMELFGTFGHVTRTYVALDQKTRASRGFGFVTFANREDGEKAIAKLNGYGYDNLILNVEWAGPRSS